MGIGQALKSVKKIPEWAQEMSYQTALGRCDTSFEIWMKHQIEKREKETLRGKKRKIGEEPFVVFEAPGSKLTADAMELIRRAFEDNPEAVLVYGDEDVPEKNRFEGEEYEPWLKPMWSPEFFLSCFYFGNFYAIRENVFREFAKKKPFTDVEVLEASHADPLEKEIGLKGFTSVKPDKNGEVHLRPGENESYFIDEETNADLIARITMRYEYRMVFEILLEAGAFDKGGEKKVIHIPEILVHDTSTWDLCRIFDCGPLKFQGISEEEIRGRILKKACGLDEETSAKKDMVSIVIPSKDHPEILTRCIKSLCEETDEKTPYEIIVVDNGSSEENKKTIEEMAVKYHVSYLYRPMEFNFSKMCNLGAEQAKGKYILLLNDDMEILQSNWLEELLLRAQMPYAGAVGAKLLYPGTTLIQHAGITNIRLGPTHKLQRMDDFTTYYFGQNRMAHDMIGVTGACLLVKKSIYQEVGGLSEALRVAFNDVDFCFSLHEKGYSNIQCNDVILYHHESLSRGNDLEDAGKTKRLKEEKEKLFELHPELFAKDPYYSKYMTFDVCDVGYTYYFLLGEHNRHVQFEKPEVSKLNLSLAREDQVLSCGIEYHDALKGWLGKVHTDTPYDSYIQGYSFIIGSNNACYERKLLLQSEDGTLYDITLHNVYRPDIAGNVPDQKNVELSGFAIQIPVGNLPIGNYRIGLYARKRLSKEQLIRWTSCYLPVTGDEDDEALEARLEASRTGAALEAMAKAKASDQE